MTPPGKLASVPLVRWRPPNLRWWMWTAGVVVGWVAIGWLVAPAAIRWIHAGHGPGFLEGFMAGRENQPVDGYLLAWAAARARLTGLVAGWLVVRAGARLTLRADQADRFGTQDVVLLALGVGLLAGLGEVLILAARIAWTPFLGNQLSREWLWQTPLGSGMVYLGVGGALLLLARWWPWVTGRRAIAFALVTLVGIQWLESGLTGLHWVAVVVLAAGLASRVGPGMSRLNVRWWRRRVVPALLAVVAATAVTQAAAWRVAEARAYASLPALAGDPPNLLLLVLDTVRARNLGLYGYGRDTSPFLDSLGAEGLVFRHAVSTTSWTLPSHASMFTGKWPGELSVSWKHGYDGAYPTLAEVLREDGYRTGSFIANFFFLTSRSGLARGFIRHRDLPVSGPQFANNSWPVRTVLRPVSRLLPDRWRSVRKRASGVNREFFDWIDERPGPFFAFLNYMDAHTPYEPPAPYDRTFTDRPPRLVAFSDGVAYTPEQLRELEDAYDNAIRYVDDQIRVLCDGLRARGLLQHTFIIVTADHGESFGEQDPRVVEHATSLYYPTIHVPLLVIDPRAAPGGTTVGRPVSVRDIPATLLDVAGLTDPAFDGAPRLPLDGDASRIDGTPVLAELQKDPGAVEWDPGFHGYLASVVVDSLHYIRRGDGKRELYDVTSDPLEQHDLSGVEAFRSSMDRLGAWLDTAVPPRSQGR